MRARRTRERARERQRDIRVSTLLSCAPIYVLLLAFESVWIHCIFLKECVQLRARRTCERLYTIARKTYVRKSDRDREEDRYAYV